MDAPRVVLVIFLLLFLFASPDTQIPSPSQQRELEYLVIEERHALDLLNASHYGDLDAGRNRWINVTGLRKEDGYAWDLLPKVQERIAKDATNLHNAWRHSGAGKGDLLIGIEHSGGRNTSNKHMSELEVPMYHNVTGIIHGKWVRSRITREGHAPILNLTALAPRLSYTTDRYNRNITGTEGDLRIKLDERNSEIVTSEPISAREISAELTLKDDKSSGDGWEMTLHGVHYPNEGGIVLTTTGQRFGGIFTLPHFTLSQEAFSASRRLLNRTLTAAIEKQVSASERSALSPWSSTPNSASDLLFPTPHCEYILYLQQHPLDRGSLEVPAIEAELQFPTGRSFSTVPPIEMFAVIFSPDCGFVLESKGPPDYAQQDGQHLSGPKIESYICFSQRAILTFALIICGQTALLLRQMKEASTPSTRSRISFYTIAMMSMGDGFVCMSFLIISLFVDSAFLSLAATAFLSFLGVGFFGMIFLMDIWTVQAPEREERQRQRDRQDAATITTQPTISSTTAPVTILAGADTLPLPATALRPSVQTPTVNLPPDQNAPETEAGVATTQPTAAQAPEQQTPANTTRSQTSSLYTRFYLVLLTLLFLSLHSTTWSPLPRLLYVRLLSLTYLSLFTPQIHRNILRNCRKALQWRFVIGQSLLRLTPFGYFYLYENNALFVAPNANWMIFLLGWVWLQVFVLATQEVVGPRFFVPKRAERWIPTAYDYHPVLREEDEEAGASMPIGFTQNTPASPTSPTAASSSSAALIGTKRREKGKKVFDCAICMQTLEVPVVPRGEGGEGAVGGMKDLVFGRRAYMVTPCRHIFHSVCLEGWMRYRLQCPICRDNLPPL